MKLQITIYSIFISLISVAQYAPVVGQNGTTAIHKDSSIIINWANGVMQFDRGLQNAANSGSGDATFGDSTNAIGAAEGSSVNVVSLGDNGSITMSFEHPIKNDSGHDFVIFENSIDDTFLELGHVEVSTDGINFIRLPSVSLTSTSTQTGSFGSTDATKIYNLAGKYRQGYGTPFDLDDIIDSTGINLDSINFVKIIDVVGSINSALGTTDSQGNLINDPYPTAFASCGFDLDAIGVINENKFVGIDDISALEFTIYPNPSQNFININTDHPGKIEIYSLNGQLVYSQYINSYKTIDISYFDRGLYLIKISNSEHIVTKKIIVN